MRSAPASSLPDAIRIETERTVVRLGRETDAPALLEHLVQNRAYHAPWEPRVREDFYTLDVQRRALALRLCEFAEGRSACLLVFDREHDVPVIGRVNFTQIVRGAFHGCVLGYAIDRNHEGRGYMTEALRGALEWAFAELRLHRIAANYRPENQRSERVLEKLGFVREGYARSYLYVDGRWSDHVLTALTNPHPERVRVER
ncbi:MAG: GNAT family N-acetyltransferase [Candidatus Baltobacteraceae bacterium]